MSVDSTIAIAGGGRLGLRIAQLLDDRGHKAVIIEQDHSRCQQLTDAYVGTVIEGDARRPAVLQQADPDRCDTLAALTGDTATNAGICLTANRLTDVHTVMRVTDPDDVEEYAELADRVINPNETAARTVTNELIGAGVRSIEEVTADLEILEIEIAEAAPAGGKRLADISLPRGSLVIANANGQRVSGAETVLEPGDRYIVAVESAVTQDVLNLLRG
ncbi:MAG: TrkA family potassium uptake protein [Halobacteriales archaeon]|nr:TrkA family potassium uptake protein [Halobacteriales archaeon]